MTLKMSIIMKKHQIQILKVLQMNVSLTLKIIFYSNDKITDLSLVLEPLLFVMFESQVEAFLD
jgi:hypothetical protein